MITDLIDQLETLLTTVPANKFSPPWQSFPSGMRVVKGIAPDVPKEILKTTTIVIVPDIGTDTILFTDDNDDRCGGSPTYSVLVGICKLLETVDPFDLEPASFAEVRQLMELSEHIGQYLSDNSPVDYTVESPPKLVFLAESTRLIERVYSSWWRISYG
jgi:hypothetical protein